MTPQWNYSLTAQFLHVDGPYNVGSFLRPDPAIEA